MGSGRTFKACGCRHPQTGDRLGQRCPLLRREGGGWSRNHGSWTYQLELPPTSDGARRNPLRRGGFPTQEGAATEMMRAVELLAIASDQSQRIKIADLIQNSVKTTKQLPVPEEVRRKVRTGRQLNSDITTGEWLTSWLKSRAALRPGTRASYDSHIRIHFLPAIGNIPLDKLQVSDVARVFEAIDDLNTAIEVAQASGDKRLLAKVKGRRRCGPAQKQRIRATLRAALNAAIRQRLIDINVASLVELPSGRRPKALVWTPQRINAWQQARNDYVAAMVDRAQIAYRGGAAGQNRTQVRAMLAYTGTPRPSRVMVWTPEQTAEFLRHARSHRLYALYHLIAFRGLRRGEACGLRWDQVDLEEGTAAICWQITTVHGVAVQGRPKSEAGDRHIFLDKATIAELRAHKARQAAERLQAGQAWEDSGFVFTAQTGQPLHPNLVTGHFFRQAMEAGLPPIRLHDLRHGAATFLLQAGHDMKVVQETLGLSSINIAADTYTSVLPKLGRQSAEDAAAVILNATAGGSSAG